MLEGFATRQGTARYRDRFPQLAQSGHFRQPQVPTDGLCLSSIGLGTYLGESEEAVDSSYVAAIKLALRSGINVLDSAINYRHQRSERNIGEALRQLISSMELERDEVVVCTKAGYLAFDSVMPEDPQQYVTREYVAPGILTPQDIVGGNCMMPAYLADQIERSRRNLGLQTIDVFYLHNPETQLTKLDRNHFRQRLKDVFAMLEEMVTCGKIRFYGLATWSGLRLTNAEPHYLSLFDAVESAEEVAGEHHHLRFVQAPFNLSMPEAFAFPNQVFARRKISLLDAAARLGVVVVGSASLFQGRLVLGGFSDELRELLGAESDVETAIQFARSAPGLTTALIGMAKEEHVAANIAAVNRPPVASEVWRRLFKTE